VEEVGVYGRMGVWDMCGGYYAIHNIHNIPCMREKTWNILGASGSPRGIGSPPLSTCGGSRVCVCVRTVRNPAMVRGWGSGIRVCI
jgi:hypothetical protein